MATRPVRASNERALDEFRALGRFLDVADARVFVVDEGQGPPVLFLHGIPTFSFLWRDVLPFVAPEHRVLAPDLLGFGLSADTTATDYSVEHQARTVIALLDELGIDRVSLVAHDFGALVAAELILRAPERIDSLVLLNTSLRRSGWRASAPLSLLRVPVVGEIAMTLARRWMLKLAMSLYVTHDERLDGETMDAYWWPFEHGVRRTLLRLAGSRWATSERFARWRRALAGIDVPCILIWGTQDPTFGDDLADLRDLIPQADVQVFDNANHFVPEDRPLALGRRINVFLRRHGAAPVPPAS
jgi:pimeloyl-ACP methyl ester carboxylesterase